MEGEWVDQIRDDWPAVWEVIDAARAAWGDDMGAFLCFLAVRLLEMHRILRPDGSIYLHVDHTAHAWAKCLMDAVFGKRQFQNEIAWCYKSGGASPAKHFSRKHDTILRYTKGQNYTFNPQKEKSYNRGFKPYRFKGVKEYQDEIGWYTLVGMKDYWQIDMVGRTSAERTGYPTQKPLALYERIIRASSNEGDIVLDPFCGCATTPVAAERLGRQWVGMDIWDGAHGQVIERLQKEGLLAPDGASDRLITFGQIHYETAPPERTDNGAPAVPAFQVTERYREPGPRMSRAAMLAHLLAQHGPKCQGCDRRFDDPRYLQLDHNTPRADGGMNHINNRVLLCGPCNQLKAHRFTLSGLREQNRKQGFMAKPAL